MLPSCCFCAAVLYFLILLHLCQKMYYTFLFSYISVHNVCITVAPRIRQREQGTKTGWHPILRQNFFRCAEYFKAI